MFTAIGVITTIVFAKIALRALRYRFGGACHGGSCHARRHFGRRWRGHAVDLNDIDLGDYATYRRWDGNVGRSADRAVSSILEGLELNDRQRTEAEDVLAVLHGARTRQLSLALRACARSTFDADLAAAAIGPGASVEAIDALDHLHTILTDEQRAALERLTRRA